MQVSESKVLGIFYIFPSEEKHLESESSSDIKGTSNSGSCLNMLGKSLEANYTSLETWPSMRKTDSACIL